MAKPMKAIWYDKSSFPEGVTDDQILAACMEESKALAKKMTTYYEKAKKYQRYFQYRSSLNKQSDPAVDKMFDVLENNILTFNLIRACANSAHNKIAKIKPKVTFLTKNADREKKETAKKLDQWMFKLFKKRHIYKEASQAFLEACVQGLGVVKIFLPSDKKKYPEIKKINSTDFFCDYAFHGPHEPDTAGESKRIGLQKLKEMYPEKADLLSQKHSEDEEVLVTEMYKKYKMKCTFTPHVLLDYSKWEYLLPYELLKWTEAVEGVVGVSISDEVYYIQQTITYILERVMRAIHLFAVPRVLMEKGSSPTPEDIGNLIAEIILYNKGTNPPVFVTPPAINQQVMDVLLLFWQKGFEVTGLSQLQASGQVPVGLKSASGTALRTYNQIESERFQLVRSDYEELFVRLSKKIVKICEDRWLPEGLKKKDIEEAKENITIFSSNILPETPAGRQAMVNDLFNTGMLTKTQALNLIDSPDTNKFLSSESDRISAIEIELERGIETEKMPDPATASVLGIEEYLDKARKYYARIVIEEGADSDKLIPLGQLVASLTQKLTQQAQANEVSNQAQNKATPDPLSMGARTQQ